MFFQIIISFLIISSSNLYSGFFYQWLLWNLDNIKHTAKVFSEPLSDATNSKASTLQKFTFNDLAGNLPEDFVEIAQFIKDADNYRTIGAHMPRGILLHGAPGTGKTSLARALAGETNATFIATSGSQFIEIYVGVGPSRIRELFNQAREALKNGAPAAIIFIDEIDAIGTNRQFERNSEYRNTLNELLTQLDGFNRTENIFVLAATNNPQLLDPALTRPGRFDRIVKIDLPDQENRAAILRFYLDKTQHEVSDDAISSVAKKTHAFAAADLENLVNEAAILAIREKRTTISDKDLNAAYIKISQSRNLLK